MTGTTVTEDQLMVSALGVLGVGHNTPDLISYACLPSGVVL